jgi:hypothetical protein
VRERERGKGKENGRANGRGKERGMEGRKTYKSVGFVV